MLNPDHRFFSLSSRDGTFDKIVNEWKADCEAHNEDFEGYYPAAMSVFDSRLKDSTEGHVYALTNSTTDKCLLLCGINRARLPHTEGVTLRVTNVTLCPDFDYGDLDIEEYSEALVLMLFAAKFLAEEELFADHIKFHLRSPADRQFFQALSVPLDRSDIFGSVRMAGAWLYVSKK